MWKILSHFTVCCEQSIVSEVVFGHDYLDTDRNKFNRIFFRSFSLNERFFHSTIALMPMGMGMTQYIAFVYYVELEEVTWEKEDIMCEDSENPYSEDFTVTFILDPYVPYFNFSLIVDPNDPLFEDEIKVSKINSFSTLVESRIDKDISLRNQWRIQIGPPADQNIFRKCKQCKLFTPLTGYRHRFFETSGFIYRCVPCVRAYEATNDWKQMVFRKAESRNWKVLKNEEVLILYFGHFVHNSSCLIFVNVWNFRWNASPTR